MRSRSAGVMGFLRGWGTRGLSLPQGAGSQRPILHCLMILVTCQAIEVSQNTGNVPQFQKRHLALLILAVCLMISRDLLKHRNHALAFFEAGHFTGSCVAARARR